MNVELIQVTLINALRTLFPANIWNWDYFTGLWNRYANFSGFITGAIVVAILYFASDDDSKKRGIVRVFAVVALINAIDGVYMFMMSFVHTYLLHNSVSAIESNIQGSFNPLSIMVLVLVISECYRNRTSKAFFFGLTTFGVSILMFGSGYTEEYVLIYLFIRVLIAAIICAICSKVTYVFISYIVMGVFFIISETTQTLIMRMYTYGGHIELDVDTFSLLASYKAEYIFMIFIAIIFALFELFILTERKLRFKDFSLGRATLSLVLILASSVTVIYAGTHIDLMKESEEQTVVTESRITYESIPVSYAEASSYLTAQGTGNKYGIELTFDGSDDTCWQDGQDGNGIGETLSYWFDSNVSLAKISITNGRFLNEEKYSENNRLAEATLYFYLEGKLVNKQIISFADGFLNQPEIFDIDSPVNCNQIVLEVTNVYEGSKYNDLCVTEIEFEQILPALGLNSGM